MSAVPESRQTDARFPSEGRFLAIEGARAVLAWSVVLWHIAGFAKVNVYTCCGPYFPGFLLNGTLAVYVFMMISGFVITHLVLKSDENYLPYIIRRFFRLWPAHAVCFVLSFF